DHLHDRARPVLGHQPAVLVFLDRPPAGHRGDVPAERGSRRPRAAHCKGAGQAVSAAAPKESACVLATRGLSKSFGSLVVAQDIALALPRGVRYALIGPNGA